MSCLTRECLFHNSPVGIGKQRDLWEISLLTSVVLIYQMWAIEATASRMGFLNLTQGQHNISRICYSELMRCNYEFSIKK